MNENKVYLNLEESPYKVIKRGLTFVFSSNLYKEKFLKECDNYVQQETMKLYNKYKVTNLFIEFLLVSLYKKIEKRGFKILFGKNEELNEKICFCLQLKT